MYQLLSGLSIVEVSSFVASPTAGLYCAQMGAEVIRVEMPGVGDVMRIVAPQGSYWKNVSPALMMRGGSPSTRTSISPSRI